MMPQSPPITPSHLKRLRDYWRSAGWPVRDNLEIDLLVGGLVELHRDALGIDAPCPPSMLGAMPGTTAADRDGDGYLTQAEVEGRFPVVAKDFGRVDSNGDRRISLDEFIELRRQQFEGRKAAVQGR